MRHLDLIQFDLCLFARVQQTRPEQRFVQPPFELRFKLATELDTVSVERLVDVCTCKVDQIVEDLPEPCVRDESLIRWTETNLSVARATG